MRYLRYSSNRAMNNRWPRPSGRFGISGGRTQGRVQSRKLIFRELADIRSRLAIRRFCKARPGGGGASPRRTRLRPPRPAAPGRRAAQRLSAPQPGSGHRPCSGRCACARSRHGHRRHGKRLPSALGHNLRGARLCRIPTDRTAAGHRPLHKTAHLPCRAAAAGSTRRRAARVGCLYVVPVRVGQRPPVRCQDETIRLLDPPVPRAAISAP